MMNESCAFNSVTMEDLMCRVYRAGYADCQCGRNPDPMGHESVEGGIRRERLMERRIFELEVAIVKIGMHTAHTRPVPDQLHIDLLASIERIAEQVLENKYESE